MSSRRMHSQGAVNMLDRRLLLARRRKLRFNLRMPDWYWARPFNMLARRIWFLARRRRLRFNLWMPDWHWAPLQLNFNMLARRLRFNFWMPDRQRTLLKPAVHIPGWHLGPVQPTFQILDMRRPIPFVVVCNCNCIWAEPRQLEIIRFGLDLVSPTLSTWLSISTRNAGASSATACGSDDAAVTPTVVWGAEVGSQRREERKGSLDLWAKVVNKWDESGHAAAYDSAGYFGVSGCWEGRLVRRTTGGRKEGRQTTRGGPGSTRSSDLVRQPDGHL